MRNVVTSAMRGRRNRCSREGVSLFPARENGHKKRYIFWTVFPLGIIALTGCATTRYTTVYCTTPEQYQRLKSAEPQKIGSKLTGQAQDDLKTIAGSNVELRSYGEGLLDIIGGCTGK